MVPNDQLTIFGHDQQNTEFFYQSAIIAPCTQWRWSAVSHCVLGTLSHPATVTAEMQPIEIQWISKL